ncbi:trypsin-3-like [Culicoides brevitarsis]|uniref:trypsin-3-like n=1 Tax=Culicoides brevitarsis TaxID=469753 RepID=UPI00307C8318
MQLKVVLVIYCINLLQNFRETAAYFSNTRIIGGDKVSRHQFPYQISLHLNGNYHCGGALIEDSWLLTAAHCYHANYLEISVFAGVYDLRMAHVTGQRRNVVMFHMHEDYDGGVGADDIALLKVDKAFELNDFVKVIKLPAMNLYPVGKGKISGWGSITDTINPEYPSVLHSAFLPIHPEKVCIALWRNPALMDKTFCAGTLDGDRVTCSGDSGSPFVQLDSSDGEKKLVGIVSGGACGVKNKPSIFVRVAFYNEWIKASFHRYRRQRIWFNGWTK